MTNFTLRPALETDAIKIRDLIHRAGINPIDLQWMRFVVVETSECKFIGCGQVKHHWDGSLELASIAVEEKYRGQGVARMLIEHLLSQSSRPLFLMCRSSLVTFYEKFGFCEINLAAMPPYFRWISRLVRVLGFVANRKGPRVMRLD
jgi:N-acetylglutamate synthase-like GNAT family acetyltransferase